MDPTDALCTAETPNLTATGAPPTRVFVAHMQPGGEMFEAAADEPLLLAAQRAGITFPNSCRNGSCRACRHQLVSGAITYIIDWPGVSLDEKRNGVFLPCVACAASDLVMAPDTSL